MKYYIVSDIHGFYAPFVDALQDAGYFDETEPHKLVILGDLLDRGHEPEKIVDFIKDLLPSEGVILVKGNHEDLFYDLAVTDGGNQKLRYTENGTYTTAIELTGWDPYEASLKPEAFACAIRNTDFFKGILPRMVDYYETEHYVFTHGWVPACHIGLRELQYRDDWRTASPDDWSEARWRNGMIAVGSAPIPGKTVVCGHRSASIGHSTIERQGSTFGPTANYTPYFAPGIIAIDACTAKSASVNCILIED